jgi:DNA-directed RNA polymerase specialized sigma24 family protein
VAVCCSAAVSSGNGVIRCASNGSGAEDAVQDTLVQAWREENELAGRTLMRGGAWLI